jgi:hypothetical protein
VLDKDGEDLKECMFKSVSPEGEIEIIGERHDLNDKDKIAITEVIGMKLKDYETHEFASDTINETIHEVTVLKPNIFKVGSLEKYEFYEMNGMGK